MFPDDLGADRSITPRQHVTNTLIMYLVLIRGGGDWLGAKLASFRIARIVACFSLSLSLSLSLFPPSSGKLSRSSSENFAPRRTNSPLQKFRHGLKCHDNPSGNFNAPRIFAARISTVEFPRIFPQTRTNFLEFSLTTGRLLSLILLEYSIEGNG